MMYQASLRATAKQSSTKENHAKHFSAAAYVSMLAAELKLLADNFNVLDCFPVARNDGLFLYGARLISQHLSYSYVGSKNSAEIIPLLDVFPDFGGSWESCHPDCAYYIATKT